MILVIDIGNSSAAVGVYKTTGELVFSSKFSAVKTKLSDEYAVMLNGIFELHDIDSSQLDGCIMSSVVPPLTVVMSEAVRRLTGLSVMYVGPGIKTGLNIKIDNHTQLGADIVANTTAAFSLVSPPFVIIDMGSATTLTVVNRKSELCGVIIAPGVRAALDSLSASAAELPYIALEAPSRFLARNTSDSMKCGTVYGTAFMLEGFIERIRRELEITDTERLSVIATGGLSECVIPFCREEYGIRLHPTLTLDGLYALYRKNLREPK